MNKEEAVKFITETYIEAWEKFSAIYNLSQFPRPELYITSKISGTAGLAFLRKNRVEFNITFCMTEGHAYDRTIYHELAHIVQYRLFPQAKQAHGPEFRSIMQSVGKNPSTYHTYNVAAAKELHKNKKSHVLLIDSISANDL